MADLILKADVATYLNITLTAPQITILDNQILPSISQYVRSYCNRSFDTASADFTELFDGGFSSFFVKEIPITSIDTIKVDTDPISSDDYVNKISFVQLKFTPVKGFNNVSIKYKSGQSLPKDLKFALIQWASELLGESGDDTGISSSDEIKRFTAGSVSIEYRDDPGETSTLAGGVFVPGYVFDVINRYRIDPK
jgi:hypothetical protein